MSINILDQIVKDIKLDSFFDEYKYKRTISTFFKKSENSYLAIGLGHKRDWLNDAIVIAPMYGKHFFILTKWFEKFSFKTLQDQRTNDNVCTLNDRYGIENNISFKYDLSDYDEKIQYLIKVIKELVTRFDQDYATLEDFYNRDVVPKLDGIQQFKTFGADWIFQYLTLGHLVDPDRYPELKVKLLEHVEWMHSRNEPNVARYYDRLDEIISYMENNVKL